MKAKILRNIFITVSVLFTLTGLQAAGMNDGVRNFGNMPLVSPQATFITFDAPDGGDLFPSGINPVGAITGTYIREATQTWCFTHSCGLPTAQSP